LDGFRPRTPFGGAIEIDSPVKVQDAGRAEHREVPVQLGDLTLRQNVLVGVRAPGHDEPNLSLSLFVRYAIIPINDEINDQSFLPRGGRLPPIAAPLLNPPKFMRKHALTPSAQAKNRIQALLREIAIKRDGGCILRHYPEAGQCGGYAPKSGHLILQAEHLNTRERNISFGDMRNIVCLCQRHHGYFKQQNGALYWELIRRHIEEERWAWLQRVIADRTIYTFTSHDWLKIEIALTQELNVLES
jgi:hypothetical protein